MANDYHRPAEYHRFVDYVQNIFDEPNPYERMLSINQLREYLNRLCLTGHFGPSHARACQRIVDLMHQSSSSSSLSTITDESNSDTSSTEQQHGIQKRFFCNGFIGCKNAAG